MSTSQTPTGPQTPGPNPNPLSIGELFGQLTEQVSRLVRAEVDLAKKELVKKATNIGLGAGLLIAAALLSLYGLGVLIHSAVLGLSNVFAPWLAALTIGAVLFIIVGVLALIGMRRIKAGTPPTPEAAVENLKESIDAVKEGFQS